ncbi:hypothetical protein COL922a_008909 [Colletotrichum nupharicola]|nr:hypothetical protein COL922a_008909 [Colletotrichum nupharicola]
MAYDRDEYRNDTVLDLLRCIPYIDSPSNSPVLVPYLMKDTSITDYRSEDCIEGLVTPITGQDPPLPPSCAVIAICRGRNGYEAILDTADGYICWEEPTGGHDEPAPALNSTLERFRGDPAN